MGNLLRNEKFRELLFQALMVSVVATAFIAMIMNTRSTLEAQGLTIGFNFQARSTG
ncbi:MAG: ABC-type amino acid transport system permease subunit [Gammaproteobacteria bacterium]|jgi:ABC-type amino acid transport system permease subunit